MTSIVSAIQEHRHVIEAIEKLFVSRKRFERFAMLYTRDLNQAQDMVMESFTYMWEHRDSIDFGANVEAYMFNVVKHKCLDWLDRRLVRLNAEEKIKTDAMWELEMNIATLRAFDPAWLYDEDITALVREAMERLPEKTRTIFMMSRFDDRTYAEIAEEMGLSVKSVEFHISKALRELRSNLGPYFAVLLIVLSCYRDN